MKEGATLPCAEEPFVPAGGRELYHWLGFEAKEAPTGSAATVVNSLPCQRFQRPCVLLQVAACVCTTMHAGWQLGAPTSLAGLVATYFMFDIYSGWVHYCLDWEGFNDVPFFGPLCQTFQHHHKDTTFIWRSSVWTSLSEVGIFLHISDTLPLAVLWLRGMHAPPIFWFCSASKTLWSMVGELGHRAAHKPPRVRSGFECAMQRAGIYLDPKYHLGGHHRHLDQQFCELGWMDAVFDAMRCVVSNRWAWGVFTLVASYADTWLLGAALTWLMGGGPQPDVSVDERQNCTVGGWSVKLYT